MSAPKGRRWLRISLYALAGLCLALVAAGMFLAFRFQPIARNYFLSTLRNRYQSDVEMGNLHISFFPSVKARGERLVLWFHGRHDIPPMIEMRSFTVDTGFAEFFRNPKRIRHVRLEGLRIHTPPRSQASSSAPPSSASQVPSHEASYGKVPFVLDEVTADGTILETTPNDPAKLPLIFEIRQLTLNTVGAGQPMTFHAELTNPKPAGLVHADGKFGPWNAVRPVDTPVSGRYTFRDADLGVFKGITGILSSDGQFTGELDRVEVLGTTETPNFALKISGHSMPLHTDFQATVDGSNGNTVLHPVHARLGHSEFFVEGAIDRVGPETGKTILLTTKSDASHNGPRLEDFLRLSLKGSQTPLTGGLQFDAKVKIPPGDAEVIDRLELAGRFSLSRVKFSSADVQSKIAGLSHRAQGEPENHDPDVAADFSGRFQLRDGLMSLPDLFFKLPGVDVNMHGKYGLRSQVIDFRGTARLDATVSRMTTGLVSKLLRPLDGWFSRDGAGTQLPIVVRGTRGEPSFSLDFGKILKRR